MKIKLLGASLVLVTLHFLSGCNSEEEIIDSIDDIPTNYSASINYINMTGLVSSFYTKSSVYFNDVYSSEHFVVELLHQTVSPEKTHSWIEGYASTYLAVQESATGANRAFIQQDLQDNKSYWYVALGNTEFPILGLIEKASVNAPESYSVRVFASTNADIRADGLDASEFPAAQKGLVTEYISIQYCSDLFVDNIWIDLCQSGEVGRSYLVVVDPLTADYIVIEESI